MALILWHEFQMHAKWSKSLCSFSSIQSHTVLPEGRKILKNIYTLPFRQEVLLSNLLTTWSAQWSVLVWFADSRRHFLFPDGKLTSKEDIQQWEEWYSESLMPCKCSMATDRINLYQFQFIHWHPLET